jgi:hypothetical protein
MVVHTSETAPIFVNFIENAPNWPQGYGKIGYERERERQERER